MTAYVVVIRDDTKDDAGLQRYAELAPLAPIDKLSVIAAKTGHQEVLEGAAPDAVVILRFPTLDDAKKWYFSPEYQKAIPHRQSSATFRAFLLEGSD